MKYYNLTVICLLTACGQGMFPLRVDLVNNNPASIAIKEYSNKFNTELGCGAIAFVNREAPIEIYFSTELEMSKKFPSIEQHGGLAIGEYTQIWHPGYTDSVFKVWFAVDYENADGVSMAKTWLGYVGWLAGLQQNTTNSQSIMWNHPTLNPNPVEELIFELGGKSKAKQILCPYN